MQILKILGNFFKKNYKNSSPLILSGRGQKCFVNANFDHGKGEESYTFVIFIDLGEKGKERRGM